MSEKKTDLKTEINTAFKLVSALSVNGDVVDIVAEIRVHLREAYRLTEDKSAVWALYKALEKEEKGVENG